MLSDNRQHPWRWAIRGWGAFIVATILFLIFDFNILNIYWVLGLLTAAIIPTIGNAAYVIYTKRKSKKSEKQKNVFFS
ncbi:hypothetical protein CSV71_10460 [Sporosarcina sp. P21c]|uniref:hypothetical protein n=1 Tax=unclassified Sporosarcina TaxID=2647733 RepID=UPI000C1738E3|nr:MULTISPECIES: hypothetical protein [unclassified Sporosarcina]PIC67618.1 hypothetical protein CSV78_06855 [Sporosarcina sp. P16a]PIC89336.1 hypothetical protein CSV71_10460 [Sporosarcina sp. P21c]PIC93069.1 hypothetical protein CSV70_07605 [Sporosarcina sp. P25]